MQSRGDIPEKDEVRPNNDSPVGIVAEILQAGGTAHVYLDGQGPGEDIHLHRYDTHVFTGPDARDGGLIYTQVGDDEHWIVPEHITQIERHYD